MKQDSLQEVRLSQIEPWPGLNPRRQFTKQELGELAASIKQDGLLQPVAAAPAGKGKKEGVKYWLFVGERRLRACRLARTKTIQVLVRDVDEATAHRLAGIENIERSDLTAIEEAVWLQRELELSGLTQQQLAKEIKRSQAWIANRLRFLELPPAGQAIIHEGLLAPATARDLLLRFMKLDDRPVGLFGAIGTALKKASENGATVPTAEARGAIDDALEKAGAVRLGTHLYLDGRYIYLPQNAGSQFAKKHAGRCVKVATHRGHGGETWWTFAKKEWIDYAVEQAKKERTANRGSGVDKKKLADPKLGPEKKPTTLDSLRSRFGWDGYLPLSSILDPSKIDPSHVTRVWGHEWRPNGSGEQEKVEVHVLCYVGPNISRLRNRRSRAVSAEARKAMERQDARAFEKAAAVDEDKLLRGLLDALIRAGAESRDNVVRLLKSAGFEPPEKWNAWDARKSIDDVEGLTSEDVRKIAAALSAPAAQELPWQRRDKAEGVARRRIDKQAKKATAAWIAEHVSAEIAETLA